jgi:hypothetical protein
MGERVHCSLLCWSNVQLNFTKVIWLPQTPHRPYPARPVFCWVSYFRAEFFIKPYSRGRNKYRSKWNSSHIKNSPPTFRLSRIHYHRTGLPWRQVCLSLTARQVHNCHLTDSHVQHLPTPRPLHHGPSHWCSRISCCEHHLLTILCI